MINVDLENINRFFGGKISRVNFLPVRDPIISATKLPVPCLYTGIAVGMQGRVLQPAWVQANCL